MAVQGSTSRARTAAQRGGRSASPCCTRADPVEQAGDEDRPQLVGGARAARRRSSPPPALEPARGGGARRRRPRRPPRRSVPTVRTIGGAQPPSAGAASSSIAGEVALGLGGAGTVGLVDHEHVGDLEQAGLGRLHGVAPARVDDDDGRVGRAGHLDLDLADADGLDAAPTGSRRRRAPAPPPATARASPPRWPRVAIDRMNTPSSRAWSCMRTRSPRMAPPVNGDVGSTASTATRSPAGPQLGDEPSRSASTCPRPARR